MKKLEEDTLYKNVEQVADYCRSVLTEIAEDDKYPLHYTIRSNALEACLAVAEALGSTDPRDTFWKYGIARRVLFGLRESLRQAHKLGYIQVEPELMLKLEKSVTEIDSRLISTKKEFADYFELLDAENYKKKVTK